MKIKILTSIIIFINLNYIFAEPPDWQPIEHTKYQMIVLAEVYFFDTIFDSAFAMDENSLGAFGPGGEEDCRSLAKWITPVPGAHDGYWYFTIVANQNNEQISFKLYNSASDSIYQCDAVITFNNNDLLGAGVSGFFPLRVKNSSISGSISIFSSHQTNINPEDVKITIGDSIVSVNSDYDFSLEIPIGVYNVTSELQNFYPITFENCQVEESRDTKVNFTLIEWFPDTLLMVKDSVIVKVKYVDNSYLEGSKNTLLAAFSKENPEKCMGIGNWNEQYSNWIIDTYHSENDDSVIFKIFNNNVYHVFNCKEVLSLKNDNIGNITMPIDLNINSTQNINLEKGWNWISFNIDIKDVLLDELFLNNSDSILQIKTQTKSAIWYPNFDCWIGDLTVLENGQCYMIKSDIDDFHINVEGKPIYPDQEILLAEKWSWIPYLPYNDIYLNIALENILPEIELVKDESDSIIFEHGISYEIYPKMYSGNGYKIKMNSEQTLYYPGFLKGSQRMEKSMMKNKLNNVISGTENSMILITQIYINDNEFTGENGNQAYVIKKSIDGDESRSIGIYENSNEWQGFWYFTIVGDIEENLVIDINDNNADEYYESIQMIRFKKDTLIGNPENPLIVSLEVSIDDEQTSFDYQLNQNYPNPFNPSTNIEFYLEKSGNVNISIYNINGRKINTLLNSHLIQGKHILKWDGINSNGYLVPSGIYFYKIISNGFEQTKKMILNK